MSEIKYKESDYIKVGYASIGHHSRVSNWTMNKEQSIYMDLALQDLKDVMSKIYPNWETINIEIKEKK